MSTKIPPRSKRRYIQKEINNILKSSSPKVSSRSQELLPSTSEPVTDSFKISNDTMFTMVNDSNLDDTMQKDNTQTPSPSICEKLRKWAISNNISKNALTKLLHLFHDDYPELPLSATTLLKNNNSMHILPCGEGQLTTFDLEQKIFNRVNGGFRKFNCYGKSYLELQKEARRQNAILLIMNVNVDGLPLFKSGSSQLWPILCSVNELNFHQPFAVTLFLGNSKPPDLSTYFKRFIDQIKELVVQLWNMKMNDV